MANNKTHKGLPVIDGKKCQELLDAGLTPKQVAERMGCTTPGVLYAIRKDTQPRQTFTRRSAEQMAKDDATILKMAEKGMNQREIAAAMNMKTTMVFDSIRRIESAGKINITVTPNAEDEEKERKRRMAEFRLEQCDVYGVMRPFSPTSWNAIQCL